ncbi:MAG: ADP-ribosylglycohydrolase family protein [Chloroflexaceae bacterium]|nr:ADP-ribosylglycohydrolase family protein [Chloroflexaceae bacterium]
MLGAIAGDIIGSIYERSAMKTTEFPLFSPQCHFTDDTVLTVAVADAVMRNVSFTYAIKQYYHLYPNAGYGKMFIQWASSEEREPYNSWGNGGAMRVSPIAWAFNDLQDVLGEVEASAAATHNHPEGVKGAQAVAAAIFMARMGQSKREIKQYVETTFGYNVSTPLAKLREQHTFDVSAHGSVPPAIVAALESSDVESAIRNAISLGGDSDTQACIAGAIAEALYGGVPDHIRLPVLHKYLDERLRGVVELFRGQYQAG